jgi:hypothetical protein
MTICAVAGIPKLRSKSSAISIERMSNEIRQAK